MHKGGEKPYFIGLGEGHGKPPCQSNRKNNVNSLLTGQYCFVRQAFPDGRQTGIPSICGIIDRININVISLPPRLHKRILPPEIQFSAEFPWFFEPGKHLGFSYWDLRYSDTIRRPHTSI